MRVVQVFTPLTHGGRDWDWDCDCDDRDRRYYERRYEYSYSYDRRDYRRYGD